MQTFEQRDRFDETETLASLARLWPNRTHESNWMKDLLCGLGLHRWHRLDVPGPHSTTIQSSFCRWCPKVKLLR
jgi:hypothetical protein